MIRKSVRWAFTHRKTSIGLILVLAFVLLNVLAYVHAHAMTHYAPSGLRTTPPESLSALEKVKVIFTGVTVPRPSAKGVSPGLPFETHRFATKDNIELEGWYLPHPGAHGLVLMFHGYAACKTALLPEAQALHELGYAVFLVDLRGGGGSSGNETTIGVREADDVAAAVDYAQAHWSAQPRILYGQSLGSVAVLRALAVQGVRPRAAVLECPFDRLVNTVANRFDAMGLPAFPCAQLLVFWGGVQHGFNGFEHNPVDYAGRVDCPVLLLHGSQDRRVTTAQAEAVFHALRGPKAFELFAGVGHESYVARQPDRWRAIVSDFLTRYTE